MKIDRVLLASLVLCGACAPVHAQLDVSLPLDGYYRSGRYMPVLLRAGANAPLRDVRLDGQGIVPTVVSAQGGEIVVPVLVISPSAREIVVRGAGTAAPIRLPLRELPSDRQMIGLIREAGDQLLPFIPPAPTIVRAELDRAMVREAPPLALEMLQSVLLDDPSLIGDPGAWLATGVQVLLVGRPPPDATWPWVEMQGLSLLRVDLLGPRAALIGDDAYLPVQGWSPGRSPALRRQVVLAGVLFSILAVACALAPRRAVALTSLAVVTIASCAILHAWHRAHAPLNVLAGQVAVEHGRVTQWDAWTYFTSRPRIVASMPFNGAVRPVLVDAAQAESSALRLHWSDDPSGRYFEFNAENDARQGFVSRTMTPRPAALEVTAVARPGPFAALARALYRDDRYSVAGQLERGGSPVVLIVKQP